MTLDCKQNLKKCPMIFCCLVFYLFYFLIVDYLYFQYDWEIKKIISIPIIVNIVFVFINFLIQKHMKINLCNKLKNERIMSKITLTIVTVLFLIYQTIFISDFLQINDVPLLLGNVEVIASSVLGILIIINIVSYIIKSDNLFVSSSVTSTMLLYIIQNKIFLSSFRNYQNFVLEITIILFLLMLLQLGLILMFYFSKKRQLGVLEKEGAFV